MADDLVDVIEVQIKAPHTVRVLAHGETAKNAEAIIYGPYGAIARRGVEGQFYTTAPTRKYRDGDELAQSHPTE